MARGPMAGRIPLSMAMERPALLPKLQILQPQALRASARIMRKPNHDFNLITRPWDIQCAAIAPVLPGDTLMSMVMQARTCTDPIRNRLVGWWNEYYLYYVPHTALGTDDAGTETTANAIRAMHLTNAALGLADATERLHNYKVGTDSVVDWVHLCMKQIVRWYHRDGEESIDGYNSKGVRSTSIYKARVRDLMWLDSMKIEDVNPASQGDLAVGEDFNDVFVPSAFATHYAQWEYMRQAKLLPDTVSFEDYLESWGVEAPREEKEDIDKPELLRYMRDFKYPSNTIDPTDGSATAAVMWDTVARADKPRRFPIPGFLVLCTVCRPKVYFGNVLRNGSTMLDDAYGWLPAILSNDPYTSLIEYDSNEGPISGFVNAADDYWVDRRDLFTRGDQFVNYDPRGATTKTNIVDLPNVNTTPADNQLDFKYASETDSADLFVDNAGTAITVQQDGVIKFNIKSAQHASRDVT